MGHSFGGWTALWLAVNHAAAVGQLVLEAPGGLRIGIQPGPPVTDPAELRRRLYLHPENAKGLIKSPEVAAANMAAFGRYNGARSSMSDLLARLPEIKARTLIVLATQDKMIPATTGHVLKEKIRMSHLTYMYDAAHGIEIDQPERMLQLVTVVPRARRGVHRQCRRCRLKLREGRPDHVVDALRPGRQHHQAVKSERDPLAGGICASAARKSSSIG